MAKLMEWEGRYSKMVSGILGSSKITLRMDSALFLKTMAKNTKETGKLDSKKDLEECNGSMGQFMKGNGGLT